MKGTVTIRLDSGEYQLEVEGKDEKETLYNMANVGAIPTCYQIINGKTSLEGRRVKSKKDNKEYLYVSIVCVGKTKDGSLEVHKSTLGNYNAGGVFWYPFKKDDFATNRINGKKDDTAAEKEDVSSDDIPF